jgi:hypothetical protein
MLSEPVAVTLLVIEGLDTAWIERSGHNEDHRVERALKRCLL